jgi:predicted nucleic acid-binding protein
LPDLVCNTSPLQYLHQAGILDWLPKLASRVLVPTAVCRELDAGRAVGIDVPDVTTQPWMHIVDPQHFSKWETASGLGAGEVAAISLALETPLAVLVLDDGPARRIALHLGLKIRGTLGIILDAKQAGFTEEVLPWLDKLAARGFRCSRRTRQAVLELAGEWPSGEH